MGPDHNIRLVPINCSKLYPKFLPHILNKFSCLKDVFFCKLSHRDERHLGIWLCIRSTLNVTSLARSMGRAKRTQKLDVSARPWRGHAQEGKISDMQKTWWPLLPPATSKILLNYSKCDIIMFSNVCNVRHIILWVKLIEMTWCILLFCTHRPTMTITFVFQLICQHSPGRHPARQTWMRCLYYTRDTQLSPVCKPEEICCGREGSLLLLFRM